MPVREIGEVLATDDPADRTALIERHLHRLENELDETRAAVSSLRRLLQADPPPLQVLQRRQEEATVAAVRATIDRSEVLVWYADAMADLSQAFEDEGLNATGPPGGLYDNELFTEDRGGVLVYLPADQAPTRGPVHPHLIAAADLAVTVHHGPHDDIEVTYGALGAYVATHALAVAGPVHERYLVGPRDTDDSTAWRTEIGWPVFRTTSNS